MNIYRLESGAIYRDVDESVGEPFRVIGPYSKLLTPWGVTLVPLGEDLTVVCGDDGNELMSGHVFAAIQFRPRHQPIQLGEFFIPEVMVDNYWFEVRRNHEDA